MYVSVIYCTADQQNLVKLQLDEGSRVFNAIERSKLTIKHPELNTVDLSVGIYGKICALNTILQENDRVEIYRPLQLTPTEARRLRAKTAVKKSS